MNKSIISEGKTLAFVSYFPVFGTLIAYYLNNENKNEFISFHIRQALGIWLFYFVCAISVSTYDSSTLRLCLWVGFGSLLLYGLFSALLGLAKPLPLLGALFQKWFYKIGH